MPKTKKLTGKRVYIRQDIADMLQQVKESNQEDRLSSFLKQNLAVILDSDNPIESVPTLENKPDKPVTLNQDQRIAIEYLNDWFNSDKQTATLSGAGGTGKTLIITQSGFNGK